MKKERTSTFLLLIMLCITASAQKEHKQPHGNAIVQIFTNFHSGFGSVNDDRGFELDRSYLGYEYRFSRSLSIKGVLDIGRSSDVGDYQRIAYIKNAMVSWKHRRMRLDAGLIGTTQASFQENFWGYRYIYKTYQDQYMFCNSADLGVSFAYIFAPWIEADLIVANGEGYKRIQDGDGLMYGAGATINPLKGLYMRLYAGIDESSKGKSNIINYAMFAGYRYKWFSLGLEYNIIRNFQGTKGNNRYGFSLYGTASLNRWLRLYARTDGLMSGSELSKEAEEIMILAGAEFRLGKYIRIAPNFRTIIPKADSRKNAYYGFISCYFGI